MAQFSDAVDPLICIDLLLQMEDHLHFCLRRKEDVPKLVYSRERIKRLLKMRQMSLDHRNKHFRNVAHQDEGFHDNQLCPCGRPLASNQRQFYMSCCGRRLMWDCMIRWKRTVIQKGRGEIAHIVMNECECGSQGSKLPFLDEARFNMGWTQGTDAEYLSGLKVHTESSSVNFELPPMSKMEYTGEQLWKCSANINDDFFILKHVAMPPPLPRQANLCVAEIQAEKDSKEKAKEWCITSDIVDDEKY